MRTKVTLVLIFLNVALFYFIFFVRGHLVIKDDPNIILGPAVANIQTLAISDAAGETVIRLERRSDKWLLTSPIVWPANEYAVQTIINELQFLKPEATFEVADLAASGQTLADFGLEKPPLTLTFTAAATTGAPVPSPVLLRIGEFVKVGNRLYILSPDGKRIYVVPRSLAESLNRTLQTLRSDELFTIRNFEARSLNLEPANGSRIRFRRENDKWFIEGLSVSQTRASKTNTEVALSRLRELRVHNFVPAAEAEAVRADLATPALRITIEGNNRRETLLLGKPAPVPPAPAATTEVTTPETKPEPSTLYYALMESEEVGENTPNRATLFTVSVPDKFLKDTLLNAQRELREKQILDIDPTTLSAITLASPQSPEEVVLQLLDTPASVAWQIVRRSPDRAPEPQPADREIVDRLITDLARLSATEPPQTGDNRVSAFIDVASEAQKEEFGFNRPARTITITTSGKPAPPPIRLLIGSGHDKQTYAKLAHQEYIYRVSDEILAETPVDALYYRQRLINELPANTSITGLKLTDLANDSVLLDATLPLTAETATTPNGKAIDAIATHLRTLRAKNFTSGELKKTVFVAGEERPWKYRLDATLGPTSGTETRASVLTLLLSERSGGGQQLAGAFDVVFEIEQPLLDALFTLTYGARDPGPPSTPAPATPAPVAP